jgi:hypothetical protein
MSKPQTQTPNSESFSKVYTREELERKLHELNEKVRMVYALWNETIVPLNELKRIIRREVCWTITDKLYRAVNDLWEIIKDAIEDMAFHKILFDEKYDINLCDLEFYKKPLGVVLVKDNGAVKPVVVWTDYETVGYYEDEKDESCLGD